jgi:hypothetical protein
VAALGPDGFAFSESNRQRSCGYAHDLFITRAKVHFDAADVLVESSHMFELVEHKVGVEFSIDSRQQI